MHIHKHEYCTHFGMDHQGEQTPTNKMIQFVEIERLKTLAINLGQMNLDFVILELFMV